MLYHRSPCGSVCFKLTAILRPIIFTVLMLKEGADLLLYNGFAVLFFLSEGPYVRDYNFNSTRTVTLAEAHPSVIVNRC